MPSIFISTVDLEELLPSKKMKKKKNKHKSDDEDSLQQAPNKEGSAADLEEIPQMKKMKKKKSKHKVDDEEDLQQARNEVIAAIENLVTVSDNQIAQSEDDGVAGSNSMEVNLDKPKRKRVRKHKRKKKTETLNNSSLLNPAGSSVGVSSGLIVQNSKSYVGKQVLENDTFFGQLPDRLEPPQYYRQGYRNKNTYTALPNNHTTFDSDNEVEEGSLEQYNFLSRPKTENVSITIDSDMEISVDNGTENSQAIVSENRQTGDQTSNVNNSNSSLGNSGNVNNSSIVTNAYTEPENKPKSMRNSDSVRYSKCPFYYPPNHDSVKVERLSPSPSPAASPTLLTRKTLSNGVSVFSRTRSSPRQPVITELSKQEQLNTVASNVSTIYVVGF